MRMLDASGRERDIATWQACAEVVKNIRAYRPADFRTPDSWQERDWQLIDQLRACPDADKVRELARASGDTFGRFRTLVHNHEATEAAKLQTVLWVLRTLYEMRDRPDANVEIIDRLANSIGNLLQLEWRVKTVPLEGDYRVWAIQATRRYDVLPKFWRYM